ncbi:MAG: GMP synthase-like glutamine amidotransferase [Oleiphilaceae bacterium]|jgi:GMP synthase (glutamine-hydrolysing)
MRIHYFQHVPFEGLALIQNWVKKRAHITTKTKLYETNGIDVSIDDYDALIILGGPMGVADNDHYPWLNAEKEHINAAIDAGKFVLGICLGAQLIASALNATVTKNVEKEIGWHPVTITDEAISNPIFKGLNQAMNVFHWHSERFDIPEGAKRLMSSAACDNQAFIFNDRVLGLQFHLEMDQASILLLTEACAEDLSPGQYVQSARAIMKESQNIHTGHTLCLLLDNWLNAGK